MKINEKNLCAYAVSATPIDREGFLYKRGELNRNFQRRYFVLKGNLLFYFEKKTDKEPVGVIILEGCTIELEEDTEHFCFKIVFHGAGDRSYILGAESQETMEQWMKALATSSYDYMKFMVAELQRQLDGTDDSPEPISLVQSSPVPPPRQRHNPFNKPDVGTSHQRSNSLRSSSHPVRPEETKWPDLSSKASITFKELHNAYGRPILTDFNIWKNEQKQVQKSKSLTVDNMLFD